MLATPRGLLIGGDGNTQGGFNVGRDRLLRLQLVPASNGTETTITDPIDGRVKPADEQFDVTGTATAPSGINRVELEVFDRETHRYLADNLTTWRTTRQHDQHDARHAGADRDQLVAAADVHGQPRAAAAGPRRSHQRNRRTTPAIKKFETFGSDRPAAGHQRHRPVGSLVDSTTFTVTGSATDDIGVQSIEPDHAGRPTTATCRTTAASPATYNTFQVEPDVVGATSTTWSYEITVPYEGEWKARPGPDTAGSPTSTPPTAPGSSARTASAPTVSISAAAVMVPPTAAQPSWSPPGSRSRSRARPPTTRHLARRDPAAQQHHRREPRRRRHVGQQRLAGWYRISPVNLTGGSYDWSYTTPFNLKPGQLLVHRVGRPTTSG